MFTDNPFGCHRLQISRYNNPWWSFYRQVKGEYILDKNELYKRADSVAETYMYCPDFELDSIKQVINELPLVVKKKDYDKLIDENQNYGDTLINRNNQIEIILNTPKSKAKEYYEERLNKDSSNEKSIVDRLLGFLRRG
jgi:hypothetical protein